jgi:hypothetical protein
MNLSKENDIVSALTAPPSENDAQREIGVAALVQYLRQGTASGFLLREIANLLEKDGTSAWRLTLARRDTRHLDDAETVERKAAAFQRARELRGLIANRSLVDEIVKALQVKWRGSLWKVEPRKSRWLLQENGVTISDIAADEPLNEAAAKKIAAAEYGFTYGTFRDTYRDIELAIRAE